MKVYIAGAMSGIQNANREAFFEASKMLRGFDYIVLNPAILPDGLTQAEYMAIDIAMLQVADSIYLLG